MPLRSQLTFVLDSTPQRIVPCLQRSVASGNMKKYVLNISYLFTITDICSFLQWEVELAIPRKRWKGLIDVMEDEEVGGEDASEPELTPEPTQFSVTDNDHQTSAEENQEGARPDQPTQSTDTRVSTLNDSVHSQTASGNEASSSAYDPSE